MQMHMSEVSYLARARRMSSSCTGAFTAEVAAAMVEAVVNADDSADWKVRLNWESCHAFGLHLEVCGNPGFFFMCGIVRPYVPA